MVNVLADTIPGIRVVKAFAQEEREIERFAHRNQHVFDSNIRVNVSLVVFRPNRNAAHRFRHARDLGLRRMVRVLPDRISVGILVGFTHLHEPALHAARIDEPLSCIHAAGGRLDPSHLRNPRSPRDRGRSRAAGPPGPARGKIELRNVSFKYGTRTVIRDVSLAIEPGEMIGLVGPSGSGKSTLVNLICRFYDVAAGSILVDGNDIRSFPVEEYRRNIGIVLQEPFLFYGTIAENIAYGRPDATPAEIVAAARAARAHEFILNLPDGYDSLVGERGQSLSGGERQRISIARALLHRSADSHSRRGNVFGRHRDRARDSGSAHQSDRRPHHDRDCPSHQHAAPRRPARRAGSKARSPPSARTTNCSILPIPTRGCKTRTSEVAERIGA